MSSAVFAQDSKNPYVLEVDVSRVDKRIQVEASYRVPMSMCAAYGFLTDYEAAKNIPGILESKVISRAGNKVQVERLIQERILFIPIEIRSVVEYSENLNQSLDFYQISGNTKYYKGTWRLTNQGNMILFKYQSVFEPNSLMPNLVIEYFIENSIYRRFERMAENAYLYGQSQLLTCK
ncbi:SRPBCC family protein [Polynucleobacter antarcticus]